MGDNCDKECSGIVCGLSRRAGAVAGTSVVIGKKITGCGVKTIVVAKDCLTLPLRILTPAKEKSSSLPSAEIMPEPRNEEEPGRKNAAKALIAALESDLSAAKDELKKVQSNADKTKSELASQLNELKSERKSLLSDLEQTKSEAKKATARKDKVKAQAAELESDLVAATQHTQKLLGKETEQPEAEAKEPLPQKAEKPIPAAVTEAQIEAAVFPNATAKIIFTKALSDISDRDAAVRIDAAKTMAGIRHDLTVKALSAQIKFDTSAKVRQECVKALTVLEMPEGLAAMERALKDSEGAVRLAAVWGLYRLGGSKSASVLLRMFSDDDEEVRRRAATCIGWIGQEKVAAELLPLLDDRSVAVRKAAAKALGNLRNRKTVSTLIEKLNDPSEPVRKAILGAIETITGKKLSKSVPRGKKEYERLVARWKEWWKQELLG